MVMNEIVAAAASESFAWTPTTAMCESASGGSRITAGSWDRTDHPAGAVKVTPAGVDRGVSAAIRSAAGFGSDGGTGDGVTAGTADFVDGSCCGAGVETQAQRRTVKTNRRMEASLDRAYNAGKTPPTLPISRNRGQLPAARLREEDGGDEEQRVGGRREDADGAAERHRGGEEADHAGE